MASFLNGLSDHFDGDNDLDLVEHVSNDQILSTLTARRMVLAVKGILSAPHFLERTSKFSQRLELHGTRLSRSALIFIHFGTPKITDSCRCMVEFFANFCNGKNAGLSIG